jgi:hypothetical protein
MNDYIESHKETNPLAQFSSAKNRLPRTYDIQPRLRFTFGVATLALEDLDLTAAMFDGYNVRITDQSGGEMNYKLAAGAANTQTYTNLLNPADTWTAHAVISKGRNMENVASPAPYSFLFQLPGAKTNGRVETADGRDVFGTAIVSAAVYWDGVLQNDATRASGGTSAQGNIPIGTEVKIVCTLSNTSALAPVRVNGRSVSGANGVEGSEIEFNKLPGGIEPGGEFGNTLTFYLDCSVLGATTSTINIAFQAANVTSYTHIFSGTVV